MHELASLPSRIGDLETKPVLKKLTRAHQALAELKGVAAGIPNQSILISTLSLQEAKDSSAIENIVTTHDELYLSDRRAQFFASPAAREVLDYAEALRTGFERVRSSGLLTNHDVLQIQTCIEKNSAGFRKLPGTELRNERTGETVYTPPQHPDDVQRLMADLERFINVDSLCEWDPLVKMAVIHHQFESIHPFYDGNGRTGRIINILYLVKEGLLEIPILYLSRYINQSKGEYYRLLQKVRTDAAWEEWVLYILDGVEQTSRQTIDMVSGIKELMQTHKHILRSELPKIYSQDLINNLFRHPYTKIDFVMEELQVSRLTATKYLNQVSELGLLTRQKIGRDLYYLNTDLYNLLLGSGDHLKTKAPVQGAVISSVSPQEHV